MKRGYKKAFVVVLLITAMYSHAADIVISFCPVTKIQASKDWGATVQIQNNSGTVLDLANNAFSMNWPSLVSLQWPFSNGVQTGTTWDFRINLAWPGTMANGQTSSFTVTGNKFSGVLMFPVSGTYTQNGKTYTVEVKHCNESQNYELYDATFDFHRDCFLYSPTKICLGQGATEIWKGEGVFDAMIPLDRPSWAISVMVAHRLFSNLAGQELVSPNFWMATAMNESRMTCDPTIVPNVAGHFPINSNANTGTGVYNPTNNCFQILNIGYSQLSNNQPDLFAQTNAFGTAQFSNVIDGGNWESSAIAMAYYHYQNIRYWHQIFCFDLIKTWKDAKDPYAIEKIFYHAYHDGPNAAVALLNDINANYAPAIAATNMNTIVNTAGTWSQINSGGSSQKVGNFTYLLDGNNGTLYPCIKSDYTTQYLGCYNAAIKWTDVLYFLDRIKILYPKLQQPAVQSKIRAVYDGINGGANVNFSDLGKVIDEIVIQMGGHDPSKYIATQYAASKVCPGKPLGVALRCTDTICPGSQGQLQVWLAGDKNFKFTLRFPDGSTQTFSNVDHSPFIVNITQPGDYEIIHYEDMDEVGNPNCNFSKITVPSKNGNIVKWDKSNVSGNPPCTEGPLVIKNTGSGAVAVTYTYNGAQPQTVNIPAGSTSYTVSTNPAAGMYIITNMVPNACGTPVNDTIRICSCIRPQAVVSGGGNICPGDSVKISVNLSGGAAPYKIKLSDGTTKWIVSNIQNSPYSFYVKNPGTYGVDTVWNTTCDTLGTGKAIVTLKAAPVIAISGDTAICAGDTAKLKINLSGIAPYSIVVSNGAFTIPINTSLNTYMVPLNLPGMYTIKVVDANGCPAERKINILVSPNPVIDLGPDKFACFSQSVLLDAGPGFATYSWTGPASGQSQTLNAAIAGQYVVQVTNAAGCRAKDSIQLIINPEIKVNFANDTLTVCPGSSVILSATISGGSPAYSYSWTGLGNGTAATFNASAEGWYILSVTDTKNCVNKDSTYVKPNNKLNILLKDLAICKGDSVLLDCGYDTQNYTVSWSGGQTTQSIYVYTAGTYSVYVTNGAGCSGSDSMKLSIMPLPDLSTVQVNASMCSGNTVQIGTDLGAGYTYLWTPGGAIQPILTINTAGNYLLQVTNSQTGCKNKTNIQVIAYPKPIVKLRADIDTCEGVKVPVFDLSAQTGYTYNWTKLSTGNTSIGNTSGIIVSTSDTYVLQVTDGNGCKNSDTLIALFRIKPTVSLMEGQDTAIICKGQTQVLNAGNPGMAYNWTPGGATSQTIQVNTGGWYTVIVSNGACKDTDAVYLQLVSLPLHVLNDTLKAIQPYYCFAELTQGVVLSALATDEIYYNYLWSPGGQTSQSIIITEKGEYSVTISLKGCSVKDELNVIDYCPTTLYVPNAFTPNKDNLNEEFGPKGEYVNDYHFRIYNRWGQLIFESKDISKGWDGKYEGRKVQQDIYVWMLEYGENQENGYSKYRKKSGTVMLVD